MSEQPTLSAAQILQRTTSTVEPAPNVISPSSQGLNVGMVKLASTVLTADGAMSIIVPTTSTHLKLIGSLRVATGTANVENLYVQLNGDTGINYFFQTLNGNDSAVTAGSASGTKLNTCVVAGNAAGALEFTSFEITIPDYAQTMRRKHVQGVSVSGVGPTSAFFARVGGGLWNSTAAVSKITLIPDTGTTFSAGSRLDAYGLA